MLALKGSLQIIYLSKKKESILSYTSILEIMTDVQSNKDCVFIEYTDSYVVEGHFVSYTCKIIH